MKIQPSRIPTLIMAAVALWPMAAFTQQALYAAVPGSTPVPPGGTPGIAIAGISEDHTSVLMATGGHSQELGDVHAVLARFGKASDDGAPHPEAFIYPGIRYLTPWRDVEKILVPFNTGMRNGDKIACAGFPEGLNWVRYDGRWVFNNHAYNHLFIVKDIRSQVVCIEFLQEHGSWRQDWPSLPGNWHVIDYVNAEVKGQPRVQIITQVFDDRGAGHRIVVHTTSPQIKRTVTLFLPQPLVNLMLACTQTTPAAPNK
ncbi:MAG: hypothetical protein ABJF10_18515 [Chthoniobacter sp.]|uniref:hypothetical protein n=1 Tax=Chthoniobacter sp. TaxID=2510640 RepID=UPI0032A3A59D